MENILTEFPSFYSGKIGLDNLLLMVVGCLYWIVYRRFQQEPTAHLHKRTALFFFFYGFLFDLYRVKSLRFALLMHSQNFQMFRTVLLILFLAYLYDGLLQELFKRPPK